MGAAAQADMERNRRVFSGGAVGSSVVKSNSNNGSAVAATTSRGQVNIFDDDDDHDHVDKNDVDVDVDDDVHEVVEDDVVSVPNRLSFGMRSGLPPVQRNSIDSSSASDDVVMRNPARLDVPILIDELPPDTIVAPPDSASAALSSLSSSVLLAPLCNDLDQCLDDFESLPARQSLMRDADLQQDDDAAAGNGDLEFELDAPSKSKRKGGARSRLRFKYPLDLRGALSSTRPPSNKAAKQRLTDRYRALAPDWWFALHTGHNILIDGVGANEQLVNDLVSRRVPRGAVMAVVSCDHPNTNIKQLLMALAHVTQRGVSVFRGAQGIVQQARRLAHYLDALADRVDGVVPQYLVLHNVDAPAMNQLPGAQEVLAILCACRLVRVVATARNPRVALLWSHAVWRRMRWYNIHASTLMPIHSELVRVGRNRTKAHASTRRSALLVLSSVSSKARVIFSAFLRTLLEHPDEGGVKMSALYDVCHAQFLVSSVLELRQQLVEFRTHSLIVVSGSGFSEKLSCSLAVGELRLLMHDIDELEQKGVEAVDDDDDDK